MQISCMEYLIFWGRKHVFWTGNKENISEYCLLKFLPRVLSVKDWCPKPPFMNDDSKLDSYIMPHVDSEWTRLFWIIKSITVTDLSLIKFIQKRLFVKLFP